MCVCVCMCLCVCVCVCIIFFFSGEPGKYCSPESFSGSHGILTTLKALRSPAVKILFHHDLMSFCKGATAQFYPSGINMLRNP